MVDATGLADLGNDEYAITSDYRLYRYSYTSPAVDLRLAWHRPNPILNGVAYWPQRDLLIVVDRSHPQSLLIVGNSHSPTTVQQVIPLNVAFGVTGAVAHPIHVSDSDLELYIGSEFPPSVYHNALHADTNGTITPGTLELAFFSYVSDFLLQTLGMWCGCDERCYFVLGGNTMTDAVLLLYLDNEPFQATKLATASLADDIGGIVATASCNDEPPHVLMAPYGRLSGSPKALCRYCVVSENEGWHIAQCDSPPKYSPIAIVFMCCASAVIVVGVGCLVLIMGASCFRYCRPLVDIWRRLQHRAHVQQGRVQLNDSD